MMKKRVIICAGIIAMTLSVPVFADDITVRTKDGKMTFTEGEAVDITTGELTNKIKEAISDTINVSADFVAKGIVNMNLGESPMSMSGSAEGTIDSYGNNVHSYVSYDTDLMGQQNKGIYETYSWADGDQVYSATRTMDEWNISETVSVSTAFSEAAEKLDDDTFKGFVVRPHFYEKDGERYYACVCDSQTLIDTMGGMEETAGYVETVKGIVGDNDFNVTVMVNAETGIPYVFSVDASGAKGDFSGEMLGMNGVVTYTCDDLYATAVIEACTDEIEVPEEILELAKSK